MNFYLEETGSIGKRWTGPGATYAITFSSCPFGFLGKISLYCVDLMVILADIGVSEYYFSRSTLVEISHRYYYSLIFYTSEDDGFFYWYRSKKSRVDRV